MYLCETFISFQYDMVIVTIEYNIYHLTVSFKIFSFIFIKSIFTNN